jgi:hypothetical protein
MPENKHGESGNITASELRHAATKTRVSPGSLHAALRNARRTLKVGRRRK